MTPRIALSRFLSDKRKSRLAAAILGALILGGVGWGGTQLVVALRPTVENAATPAPLHVWVTPPAYTAEPPVLLATPEGVLRRNETLTLPPGSVVTAHIDAESALGDAAPRLVVGKDDIAFHEDDHGGYSVRATMKAGDLLAIRQGWKNLASWSVEILPDAPPEIAWTEAPTLVDGKTVRLAYAAFDRTAVAEVSLRVTPRGALPGANNAPVEIPLPALRAQSVSRADLEDLTNYPWAGEKVSLQIAATSASGLRNMSDPIEIAVPARVFKHPISRVLIEERQKLLLAPDDKALRTEVANIMAAVAQDRLVHRGDAVIIMAMRSGAVRLILSNDHAAALSANDLLWQAAARIEDGYRKGGQAQRTLRDLRRDIAGRAATPQS